MQPTPGGKVNAANLNFQGLNALTSVVAADSCIVSPAAGGPNRRVAVSDLVAGFSSVNGFLEIRQALDTVITGNNDAEGGISILNKNNDTQVGLIGWPVGGSDDIRLQNFINGGSFRMFMRDSGDVDRQMATINPTNVELSFNDLTTARRVIVTILEGAQIRGALGNDPATGGVQDVTVDLANSNQAAAGSFGFNSDTLLALRNTVQSGNVEVTAIDAGLVQRTALVFDPVTQGLDFPVLRHGFYGTTPIVLQTGVAVTAIGIHAALVNLGLITA